MDSGKSAWTFCLRIVLLLSVSFFGATFAADEPLPSDQPNVLSELEGRKEQIQSILAPALGESVLYSYVGGESVVVDLSNQIQAIQNLYADLDFKVEWSLQGYDQAITRPRFDLALSKVGDRKLTFSLYQENEDADILLYSKEMKIFVYSRSIPTFSFIEPDHRFNLRAHEQGILLYPLYQGDPTDLPSTSTKLYDAYQQYFQKIRGPRSNFILILGGRNDGIDAIHAFYESLMTAPGASNTVVSFVLATPDSLKRASDIAKIFLSGKQQIADLVITTADNTYGPLYASTTIPELIGYLNEGGYDYKVLSPATQDIAWYAFVSRFTNTLTNSGMDRHDIYMFLLVPFLLTGVVMFRHLLGFGGIGILLPVFLTYLAYFQSWYVAIGLYAGFFAFNVIVSRFFKGYAMLYVPRIAFILSVNIAFFIFVWDVFYELNYLVFSTDHLLSYVLFFFLLERTISLIWSKDFGEYFGSFLNTLLFVFVSYFLTSLEFIQRFILGAPELLLLLIPINFFFGRYRGLRLTEYFRFRELLGKEFEE